MSFKFYVEDSIGPGVFPAKEDDPELNGLNRIQTMKKFPIKPLMLRPKKSRKRDLATRVFVGEEARQKTAGIFFTTGDNVLLLKRTTVCGNPFTWGLPGGHAQERETPLQTAHREAKEEIGKVAGKRFGEKAEGDWTCFFYKVVEPFPCELNEEHSEYAWIPFHKLKKYKLHPKFKKVAAKYVDFVEKEFKKVAVPNSY